MGRGSDASHLDSSASRRTVQTNDFSHLAEDSGKAQMIALVYSRLLGISGSSVIEMGSSVMQERWRFVGLLIVSDVDLHANTTTRLPCLDTGGQHRLTSLRLREVGLSVAYRQPPTTGDRSNGDPCGLVGFILCQAGG